jgi:hypothetical protein
VTDADIELMKLAAKAAGMTVSRWNATYACFDTDHGYFNPLLDDGDAFRLQVHVGMIVNAPTAPSANAGGLAEARFYDIVVQEPCEGWSDEARRAATRRAIVRCAAETITRKPV